jgi:polyisoprenoid-binding protein YceI
VGPPGPRGGPALIAAAALAALAGCLAAQGVPPDSVVYRLSPSSRFEVKTGKAGLFGFAGHDHLIRARAFSGAVVYYPGHPLSSRVTITIETQGLEVLTPPDTAEIRKVTAAMRSEVLHTDRYPVMTLNSKTLTPVVGGYHMVAELTMAGQTREVPVEVQVEVGADTLRAKASFAVSQTDFGITPYRGGPAGTVRVADRVTFDVAAVAVRDPP